MTLSLGYSGRSRREICGVAQCFWRGLRDALQIQNDSVKSGILWDFGISEKRPFDCEKCYFQRFCGWILNNHLFQLLEHILTLLMLREASIVAHILLKMTKISAICGIFEEFEHSISQIEV